MSRENFEGAFLRYQSKRMGCHACLPYHMYEPVPLTGLSCFATLKEMTEEEKKRCELRAEMFKALSHPLRIYMLEKLKERPRCVCELAQELGVDKSIVSKYLSQLKEAGLVEDRRRGVLVEYSLVAPCVLEMAACAETTVLLNRKRRLEL